MNRYHYTECGLDNIWLTNGFVIEDTPYGRAVGIENSAELDRVIALNIVDGKADLTSKEMRFLRIYIDMSQVDLAVLLGVGESTVRNWESGRVETPDTSGRLLRAYIYERLNPTGSVAEMIDRISHLNREEYHREFELDFTHIDEKRDCDGWSLAA